MLKNKRIIVSMLLVVLFAIIAILVSTSTNILIDEKVYDFISNFESNISTIFFKTITCLGNAKFVCCFCIIFLVFNKTRDKVGIPLSLSVITCGVLNIILKNIFQRNRPTLEQLVFEDSFSFPSGHSMIIATIYVMLMYLAYKYIKSKNIRITLYVICPIVIFLVGISRIYLRVHYFTDVLAGWTLGVVISLTISYILEKINNNNKESKSA